MFLPIRAEELAFLCCCLCKIYVFVCVCKHVCVSICMCVCIYSHLCTLGNPCLYLYIYTKLHRFQNRQIQSYLAKTDIRQNKCHPQCSSSRNSSSSKLGWRHHLSAASQTGETFLHHSRKWALPQLPRTCWGRGCPAHRDVVRLQRLRDLRPQVHQKQLQGVGSSSSARCLGR